MGKQARLPDEILLDILGSTPLGLSYQLTPEGRRQCQHICNLRLVNSLFNKEIIRRLTAFHSDPLNHNHVLRVFSHAICKNKEHFMRLLLDTGVEVNLGTSHNGGALHAATRHGHAGVIRLLLDKGASVHIQGGTIPSLFEIAISRHHIEAASVLLKHTDDYAIARALCYAASADHVDLIEFILDSRATILEVGLSAALVDASRNGNIAIVRRLLDKGTLTMGRVYKMYQDQPLQAAVNKGNTEIVRLLLGYGATEFINEAGSYFGTPLQSAAYNGFVDMVQLLLENGANVNSPPYQFGTALQMAAKARRADVVKLLLQYGADVHAKGNQFGTAIQAARSTQGNEVVVQMLLEAGA